MVGTPFQAFSAHLNQLRVVLPRERVYDALSLLSGHQAEQLVRVHRNLRFQPCQRQLLIRDGGRQAAAAVAWWAGGSGGGGATLTVSPWRLGSAILLTPLALETGFR